ncbi:MAG: SRPBCC family protein [Candidatus Melainabacteria bacterium]|nr:SRPBCC family protein [Candidatus Melainabacteria bacterium]
MLYARALALAALTLTCFLSAPTAGARPAASGADAGMTVAEKSLTTTQSASSEKHSGGSDKTSAVGSEKISAASSDKIIHTKSEKSAAAVDKAQQILKAEIDNWRRLKEGDVIIESDDKGHNRFVVARILIGETPSNVWRVLTNPYEFAGKISPRMKDVQMIHDSAERSVMKCKMEVFPPLIPFISYTVESDYKLHEFVQFRRIAGSLKDFSGTWALAPRENGQATEVTYSMHVDPGLPVPQWIIRKAMKMELPQTLIALRERVVNNDATAIGGEPLKTILAVGPIETISRSDKPVPVTFYVPQKLNKKAKKNIKSKQLTLRPLGAEY